MEQSIEQSLELLSKDAIKKFLKKLCDAADQHIQIKIYRSISSTIHYLQQHSVATDEMLACLAEQQTQGQGRLGRSWYSPFAANIYLSLAWLTRQKSNVLAKLSLVIGLAVIKVLEECGVKEGLKIKWPNDILWHNKKLAGILMEINSAEAGGAKVIISIGLNVNMREDLVVTQEAKAILNQPWTSLQQIFQCSQDRNKVVALLLCAIYKVLIELETLGANKILDEWSKYDALYGQSITFNFGKEVVSGIAVGIDKNGHLLIKNQQGKITSYASGDIT